MLTICRGAPNDRRWYCSGSCRKWPQTAARTQAEAAKSHLRCFSCSAESSVEPHVSRSRRSLKLSRDTQRVSFLLVFSWAYRFWRGVSFISGDSGVIWAHDMLHPPRAHPMHFLGYTGEDACLLDDPTVSPLRPENQDHSSLWGRSVGVSRNTSSLGFMIKFYAG